MNEIDISKLKATNNRKSEEYNLYLDIISNMRDIHSMHMYKIKKNYARNLNIYQSLLKSMKYQRKDTLYHGTSFKNVEKIILNGFNRDFNIRSKFGKFQENLCGIPQLFLGIPEVG